MANKTIITGITTTGIPHLGNYVGAIRPAIKATHQEGVSSYLFLADYHGIIKCHEPDKIKQSTKAVAATWLACGLDAERTTFYRQSDIPEILELNWILTCITSKGVMNRSHAYKVLVENNLASKQDPDFEIEMGLYSYPILMTADILLFQANEVPVGRDQVQHIEIARDIAQRFNHRFGTNILTLPEAKVDEHVELLLGLDGRKMSKSYGNTIELFLTPKQRQKAVNQIVTNLKEPSVPKFKGESAIFEIYQAFATPVEYAEFEKQLNEGLAWGEAKKLLAAKIGNELDGFTDTYHDLIANPQHIEDILQAGASKARVKAREVLARVKDAVGIRSLG